MQRIINMFPFNRVSVPHLPVQPVYPLPLFSAFPDCVVVSNPPFPTTPVLSLLFNTFSSSFFPPSLPIQIFVFRLAISPSDSSINLGPLWSSTTTSIRLYFIVALSTHIMLLQNSLSDCSSPPTRSVLCSVGIASLLVLNHLHQTAVCPAFCFHWVFP